MSGYDYLVPPRSWNAIGDLTDGIRHHFGLADVSSFPIMEFIEKVLDQKLGLLRLEVGTQIEMGAAEGHTCPNGTFIELRQDVYKAAWAGDGRARFTAAHELGHFVMHTNTPLARATAATAQPYRRSEPQANQFAAEILMPPRFFRLSDDPNEVMDRHGVSYEAACNRLRYLHSRGKVNRP
jgi:Zn-dependent peptidase ImmA (M78 family)